MRFGRLILAGSSLMILGFGSFSSSQTVFSRQELTVLLEGFSSRAELTFPWEAKRPLPTVLLLHAGYPSDLDATFLENGLVVSRNFLIIAQFLSAHGLAVARYNKRFVTSATEVDQSGYGKLGIPDFVADARAVLKVLRSNPLVDASRLYVLGWSEGALVGTRLMLEEPVLRGLVMIGPPVVIQAQDTGLLAQVSKLKQPVLILQGQADAITPPDQTRQLATALGQRGRVLYYAGLGHGLGTVAGGSQFAPMAQKPLEDLRNWLEDHLR